MNKAELIEAMAKDAGLTKADAKRALEAFINATRGELRSGERVILIRFGVFSIALRRSRKGRNPRTG